MDWYDDLPPEVQGVVLEMTFQMGTSGMLKFKKLIKAMADKEWAKAAAEMKDSRWYRQTPGRCERLADIVASHG